MPGTTIDHPGDSLIEKLGLSASPAAWTEDRILAKTLAAAECEVIATTALEHPLRIIISAEHSVLAFDYAYFLLLRSFCRSLLQGGDTRGALLALFQFEVGAQLDRMGFGEEAAGLLRSACELRTRYTVYQATLTHEAFLYELAIHFCIAHEQAHRHFEETPLERRAWIEEARSLLRHFDDNVGRMFTDPRILEDLRQSIAAFRSNEMLMEEVACDVCAIDHAIEAAVRQLPHKAVIYTDGYYVAARLAILSLYLARTIGRSAALLAQETRDGTPQPQTDHVGDNLAFMSTLRLRFQILLMKIVSMKVRLNLVPAESGFAKLSDVIETNEEAFARLMAFVTKELQETRGSVLIYPHLWIGIARRLWAPAAGNAADNRHLIALYLREFWFCATEG
jgi:hypothetical protein